MADSEASDMDFWKTDPAKVEVKRAAKKRSAAKSKAAVPVSGAQPSHAAVAFDLPSGNEDEAAPAAGPGLPAGPRLVEDDDVPMSLPSPAESMMKTLGMGVGVAGASRGLLLQHQNLCQR